MNGYRYDCPTRVAISPPPLQAPAVWQKVRHAGLETSQPTNHTADRYNLVLVRCGKNKESLPGKDFSLTS